MIGDSQAQSKFIGEVLKLITGTSFIVIGILVLVVAVIRRHAGGVRAVFLLGIWSAIYGIQRLNDTSFLIQLLPHWMQLCIPYSHALITYFTLVAAALTFRELTVGWLRQFVTLQALTALLIAVFGIGRFVLTGEEYSLLRLNNLVAAVGSVVLLVLFIVPSLSRQYLVVKDRRVMLAGTVFFGAEALVTNLLHPLGYHPDAIWDDIGFLVFLSSLGYVALQQVYTSERRLSSIENELAIARQLQFSILPTTTPQLRNLRIAAVYEPMTEVAGDFYEYLPLDDYRTGFLVADVSGHGVPAALIASMIKVAVQSVVSVANDPSELLRRLRDILSAQLQGQFVSVAYLWIDTERRTARYSAAGHPPLLCWCAACGKLARVESNGLLFGAPFDGDYPVCDIPFGRGDRFLLYTDGFSEPENAHGEAFGDHKLEQILSDNPSRPAAELSLLLLSEVRAWQPPSTPQQDDITFLVIDVL
ncbi:MAG: PP2C family protein-serine/threonine phosphatase [Candidatus Korobacteraceae bacterium]